MSKQSVSSEEKKARAVKATKKNHERRASPEHSRADPINALQHQAGNRAVQRLLAQRSGDGPFELDDDTAARINQERGGGQPVDPAARESMEAASGADLSGVNVHTSPEADDLNRQLGAKAFTTGQDIFFREGEYDPHSSSGQELLAHEMTHVVQQRSGVVSGGSRMTVNAPGDSFEQEAEAVAKNMAAPGAAAEVQRQEEEEEVQMQEEEEELQMQEEEEEEVQMQEMEEDEELAG